MNKLTEQKTPDVKTPDVKTLDGDIILNGHTYELKAQVEIPLIGPKWVRVDVDKLTPSKNGTWTIKAHKGLTKKESELESDGVKKVIQNIGKEKISLEDKKTGDAYMLIKKTIKEEKMPKTIKLSEGDLTNIIKRVLKERTEENYMFFSNLEQIKRQCDMLLEMDPHLIDEIIQNGHDWADDHVSEAKNNMDQVFDFMMNETKKMKSYIDYEMVSEGKKKTGTKLCERGKSAAKAKFKVYPSAYANGYAIQVCKGDIAGLDGKKQCSGSYC